MESRIAPKDDRVKVVVSVRMNTQSEVPPILSLRPEAKKRDVTIHALYFAQIRELLGRGGEDLPIPEGTTLKQLFTSLSKREPRLQDFADSLVYFLNEERTGGDEMIHDGDTIALCPPVSGG